MLPESFRESAQRVDLGYFVEASIPRTLSTTIALSLIVADQLRGGFAHFNPRVHFVDLRVLLA